MSSRSRARKMASKTRPASPRTWGATLIRSRGQFLGYVEDAVAKAAEAAAMRAFNLSDEQRKRLVVRERG